MEKKFRIAVNDSRIFFKFLDDFNRSHKTDFTVEGSDFLDGVEFVFIKFNKTSLDELYLLGYYFSGFSIRNGL